MIPKPAPEDKSRLLVELTEWDQAGPSQDPRLKGRSFEDDPPSRRLIESLRGKLDVREGYDGLEITSTSYVGRVDIGVLRIAITPKLPAMPLACLLRYAYSLRDLTRFEETRAPTTPWGLHDLLIAMLVSEVEELLHRGFARRYVSLTQKLESPRGRLLVEQIAREGGVREARLPCRTFERRANWQLNQVLRAGLESAARMTEHRDLRYSAYRLAARFGDVERLARLNLEAIDQADRELTRLTAAYRPALTILRLLHEVHGLEFENPQQASPMPGFLFDMNVFFQRLLSRFLRENLTRTRISDEVPIRNLFAYSENGNPKGRKTPKPRPDYALYKGNSLHQFLDAKYRDIWRLDLPPAWLYQLSLYALASPNQVSVLLYPTMTADARDQRIEIHQPVRWSDAEPASVIVRPVLLPYLAEILDPGQAANPAGKRRELADQLVDSALCGIKSGYRSIPRFDVRARS